MRRGSHSASGFVLFLPPPAPDVLGRTGGTSPKAGRVAEGVSQTERELRERLDVERTLSLISRAFIDRGVEATDACINDSLALIGELTRTERAYVFVSPDGGVTFDMKYEWHRPGTTSQLAAQQAVPASSFP